MSAFEVPTGCPDPGPFGFTGVHTVQLGAGKSGLAPDAEVSPYNPVVTGF